MADLEHYFSVLILYLCTVVDLEYLCIEHLSLLADDLLLIDLALPKRYLFIPFEIKVQSTQITQQGLYPLFGLIEENMKRFLCNLVECHIQVDSPGEWLSLTKIEGPKTLQLFINCIEDCPIMHMYTILYQLILKLVLFKLH